MEINDIESNGFSFIWSIHNFSYCVQKTDYCLNSPLFELSANGFKFCRLELYPRGYNKHSDYVCFCLGIYDNATLSAGAKIAYVFSIRTVKGLFRKVSASESIFYSRGIFSSTLSLQKIHTSGTEAFLDNDTLTVRFRIFKVNSRSLESEQCHARTIIGVERVTYNLDLEPFGNLKKFETKKQPNLTEISSFTINGSLSKGILSKEKFDVLVIKRTNANKLYFSTCSISLLDSGKLLQSDRNEHWFEKLQKEQVWTVSFTPTNLPTQPKQNSTLSLLCEFAVSFGVKYSEIENTVYGTTVDRPLVRSMDLDIPVPTTHANIRGSWKDNLRCFYSEGKLSDFTIRTPRKTFAVHKIMLCAQSAVFSAMFEGDVIENRTGIAEIEDLEDDTISMMLVFVYTGIVKNLDLKMAFKLYFAADKYEMTELKEKCSSFIKNNLSTSNACECLILADMHKDQDLKSAVQDFVIKHSTVVINSSRWKEFMKEHVNLSAETMHLMFMRNLKV